MHAGGFAIAEDRGHQGCEQVHLGRHHQHISRGQAGVGGHQLQDLIPHDLHLPQPTWTGDEQQRSIAGLAIQQRPGFRLHQLLLQLLQQAGRPAGVLGGGGGAEEQIPFLPSPQLGHSGALQQLLKFRPQPAKTGLQAGHLQQPVLPQGSLRRLGPAPPELPAGAEQVDLYLDQTGQGLQQFHLQRRHAAQPKQPDRAADRQSRQILAGPSLQPLPQQLDGPPHPQREGRPGQAGGQQSIQQRLPMLQGLQRFTGAIDELAGAPGG